MTLIAMPSRILKSSDKRLEKTSVDATYALESSVAHEFDQAGNGDRIVL